MLYGKKSPHMQKRGSRKGEERHLLCETNEDSKWHLHHMSADHRWNHCQNERILTGWVMNTTNLWQHYVAFQQKQVQLYLVKYYSAFQTDWEGTAVLRRLLMKWISEFFIFPLINILQLNVSNASVFNEVLHDKSGTTWVFCSFLLVTVAMYSLKSDRGTWCQSLT